MAHMKAEIEKLMRARRAIIEAIADEENSSISWSIAIKDGRQSLSDAEEQIVATYVLALMTNDVATSPGRY